MTDRSNATGGVFSRTTLIALALVSLVSFIGWVVLSAYSDQLDGGQDGDEHALSLSAVGYAGIVRLMNRIEPGSAVPSRGTEARYQRALNVITLESWQDFSGDDSLAFVEPVLIVLPKWTTFKLPERRGWVQRSDQNPTLLRDEFILDSYSDQKMFKVSRAAQPSQITLIYAPSAITDPVDTSIESRVFANNLARRSFSEKFAHFQTLDDNSDLEAILVNQTGETVLARLPQSRTYILSDPDFINNLGLAESERARFSVDLLNTLKTGDNPVFFDLSRHGFERTRNMLKLAFEPPFGAATLATFIAALALAWRAGMRFGPARHEERAYALGKRALADNSAALIKLAGRDHRYAVGYLDLTRRAAARMLGAPRQLSGDALDNYLERYVSSAEKHKQSSTRIGELRQEAQAAHDRAALVQVARRLFSWKQEFNRERR